MTAGEPSLTLCPLRLRREGLGTRRLPGRLLKHKEVTLDSSTQCLSRLDVKGRLTQFERANAVRDNALQFQRVDPAEICGTWHAGLSESGELRPPILCQRTRPELQGVFDPEPLGLREICHGARELSIIRQLCLVLLP